MENMAKRYIDTDLNSIHRCLLYRCSADIAKGLAEQWGLESVKEGFEVVVKIGLKHIIKGGVENDN